MATAECEAVCFGLMAISVVYLQVGRNFVSYPVHIEVRIKLRSDIGILFLGCKCSNDVNGGLS